MVRVRDAMHAAPQTVPPGDSVADLERELLAHRVGGLPVVDGRKLVGIACRSDILRALGYERSYAEQLAEAEASLRGDVASEDAVATRVARRLEKLTVADVMVHDVETVAPDTPIAEAAERMVARGIHRLPVVENGELVGILTGLDLARLLVEGRLRAG